MSEDEYENLSKNISNKLYDIESLNTIPKPVDLLSFARQIAMGMVSAIFLFKGLHMCKNLKKLPAEVQLYGPGLKRK